MHFKKFTVQIRKSHFATCTSLHLLPLLQYGGNVIIRWPLPQLDNNTKKQQFPWRLSFYKMMPLLLLYESSGQTWYSHGTNATIPSNNVWDSSYREPMRVVVHSVWKCSKMSQLNFHTKHFIPKLQHLYFENKAMLRSVPCYKMRFFEIFLKTLWSLGGTLTAVILVMLISRTLITALQCYHCMIYYHT